MKERKKQSPMVIWSIFTNELPEKIIGIRGGEALKCVYVLQSAEGCGFGPHCEHCTIRNTVLDTIETGQNYHQLEASLPIDKSGLRKDFSLLISTAGLELGGEVKMINVGNDYVKEMFRTIEMNKFVSIEEI